jgi:hypothetical protein
MSRLHNILVAVDFSETSEDAVSAAAELRRRGPATVAHSRLAVAADHAVGSFPARGNLPHRSAPLPSASSSVTAG